MSQCKELFLAAAELLPEARGAFLKAKCGDNSTLRTEVERLLETLAASDDFLEVPAIRRPAEMPDGISDTLGSMIGRYRLTALLGEGGMGVVWQADQSEPVRRTVAIKLLKPGMQSRQVIARFEAERRALERMDHPNIARVLDAGTADDGLPFVVMELVRGTAVTTYCDARRLTLSERIQLFIPVCRAVQHAHSKGIIHRDLKPTNILVADEEGGPTPKVIDFGIARPVERSPDETSHTRALVLLGTPAYVSPEQALAGSEIDTRTDVYSLGAVLYELICGETPFSPQELMKLPADEMLRTLRQVDPPRPSRRVSLDSGSEAVAAARDTSFAALRRTLKGDFDRIAMKALEKQLSRRYETAAALADDLDRLLRHEPVMAADPSALYIAAKFARRNRAGVVATVLVVACLLLGTIVSWLLATRAIVAEERTRVALNEAKANEKKYHHQAYISDLNLADDAARADDPRRLRELLDLQVPADGETDLRGFEWNYLRRRCTVPGQQIDQISTPFYYARFSPDRRLLVTTAKDGIMRFYDTTTWRQVRSVAAGQGELNSAVFSDDGRRLVTAGDQGNVKIWDTTTWARPLTIQVFEQVAFQAIFTPVNGELWVIVCGRDEHVKCFSAETGEPRGQPLAHGRPVEAIAASGDARLATASEDGVPRLWDLASGDLIREGNDVNAELISVAFSPDRRWVAYGMNVPGFVLWDIESESPPKLLSMNNARPEEGESVQSISFLADSRTMLLSDRGGVVRTVSLGSNGTPRTDLTAGRQPRWAAHGDWVYSTAATSDGATVVTAGRDGELNRWNPFSNFAGHVKENDFVWLEGLGEVEELAGGPDNVVAICGPTGARLLDLDRKRVEVIANSHYCVIDRSTDGRLIVAGTDHVGLTAWKRIGNRFVEQWRRNFSRNPTMVQVVISRDDRFIGALISPPAPAAKEVHLIDATNGVTLSRMQVPGSFALDLSPLEDILAVGQDSDVLILGVPKLDNLQRLPGHRQSIPAICFSPDGSRLATGAGDRKIILWNTGTWKPSPPWVAHGAEVRALAFTPDGSRLLSSSRDLTPALWEVETRRLLMRFPKLEGSYWPMIFTGDGGRIVGRHPAAGVYLFDGRPIHNRL